MNNRLRDVVTEDGVIPLCWAGATDKMDYLNLGDALSPVMVSLVSGLPVARVPMRSPNVRMGAVGTIGHGFAKGETFFWGTGCSNWRKPSAPMAERERFVVPDDSTFNVCATRGPISRKLLGGAGTGPFCDPVWILPRFFNPQVEKKYELGIILHLSELDGRELSAGPLESVVRAHIPDSLKGSVKTINTLTAIDAASMGDKMTEILECKRIVSTSLHGLVIAESYNIPCIYWVGHGADGAVSHQDVFSDFIDSRMQDLYSGIGLNRMPVYSKAQSSSTDFDALIQAIDDMWQPVESQGDALIDAFPLDVNLVEAPADGTIWDLPLIADLPYQQPVSDVRKGDIERTKRAKARL